MIDWTLAIWAGLVGGVAMSVLMTVARKMGLVDANMARYEGCMITRRYEGADTYVAGLVMHLVLSVLVAFVYAWAFALLWEQASWTLGLVLGLGHWAIAGIMLPVMDRMNPCVRDGRIEGFGAFGSGRGAMMIAGFLMSHLAFGALVGWIYRVPTGPI